MNFATAQFNQAVTDFKALCGTHTQLFRYGQFYVSRRTLDDLLQQIVSELSANLRFLGQPDQLANTIAFFKNKLSDAVTDIDVRSILTMINLLEVGGDMAAIRAMFTTPADLKKARTQSDLDKAHAQADFNAVWSNSDISTAPALSGSPASFGKARAAADLELGKCAVVLVSLATKLIKKRGGVRLPPTVVMSVLAVAGAIPKQTAPGVPGAPGVAAILARETLSYTQPAVLTAAADRMRAALGAHGYVQCGVLSGALHEHSVFPTPEHYVLVFAHGPVDGQEAFLFWDPDAGRSNITTTPWGPGFGVLFSRAGRLCTGFDDADLADIERTAKVTTEGDHLRDVRRHSYQVYNLQTLPIPATVKVHVKVLSPPAGASVDDMMDRAVGFFAQNGLEVIELSRELIDTPGTDLQRFQRLFVGADPDGDATAEVADLHTTLRQSRDSGVTPAASEIVIAFVDSMVPAQRGCSIHPLEQPGVVISSALATEWTLAHEIARVLGLLSSIAPGHLTFPSTERIEDEVPPLSEDNQEALMTSPLVEV